MTKTDYLYGYAGGRKTLEQMNASKGWTGIHPEVRRRALALMNDCPHDLGFGNGFRTAAQQQWTNQNSAGTTVGNSYHEATDPLGYSLAIDFLNYAPAIVWANQQAVRYGFKTGASWSKPERWHFQPYEVPSSKRYYNANVHTLRYWSLPNTTAPRYYSPFPAVALKPGDTGSNVKQLQKELTAWGKAPGSIDGQYGPRTTEAVKQGQREVKANGIDPGPIDGWFGPKTRSAFDRYYQSKGWGFR